MAKGMLGGLFGKYEEEERNSSEMNDRISELESRISNIEKKLALSEKKLKNLEAVIDKIRALDGMAMNNNAPDAILQEKATPVTPEERITESHSFKQLYMNAPTIEGVFTSTSDNEEIGKSLYVLTTLDYVNGSFVLLDSADAIATAMISISQFIKPVCKVVGNANAYPTHIITDEEGTAVNEDGAWKVTKKAVVRFEN